MSKSRNSIEELTSRLLESNSGLTNKDILYLVSFELNRQRPSTKSEKFSAWWDRCWPMIISVLVLIVFIIGSFTLSSKREPAPDTRFDEVKECTIEYQEALPQPTLQDLAREIGEPYGLGEELVAIVEKESSNGIYPINLQDPSCGVTHIHISTYLKRNGIRNTKFNRNKACAELVADNRLAIQEALKELQYWQSRICSQDSVCSAQEHRRVLSAYNAGYNNRSLSGQSYADDILAIINKNSLHLASN